MEKLSEDDLTNIVVRLPVKKIVQMRCLSKNWNAFLSRPSFIKSHLDHASHNVDEYLLVFSVSFFNQLFTAHLSQSPHLNDAFLIDVPIKSQTCCCHNAISLIGSVNGLICFSTHRRKKVHDIHIWNPSLSTLLDIPSYITPSHNYDSISKFGFDPKTDDYKVIKIAFCYVKYKSPDGKFYSFRNYLPVEVYSMRKGSWEFIAQKFPSHIKMIRDRNDVFINRIDGHLHWLCDIGEDWRQLTVVAFDLNAESFSQFSLPNSLLNNIVHRRDALGVLDGKLCMMSSFRYGDNCEVWVMNKYGVAESWVKRHVLSFRCGILAPFGFTLKNEFLFKASDENLYLFDPISDKVKSFQIKAGKCGQTKFVQYVESLVWVVPDKCKRRISKRRNSKNQRLHEA